MYTVLNADELQSRQPAWLYAASEPVRVAAESASFVAALPALLTGPRGDGHAVMTLPGFLASDLSTRALRAVLRALNFDVHPWKLGRNTGRAELIDALNGRFLDLSDAIGKPISLVGQSLGGVLAREIARRHPDRVRMVVTLGSPFGADDDANVNPLVQSLFERISASSAAELRNYLLSEDPSEPPPVPSVAIYSRSDGVVSWHTCLERDRPHTENIEVIGSHSGMAVQPAVVHAVADRLAMTPRSWQRFERQEGLRSYVYPQPVYAAG